MGIIKLIVQKQVAWDEFKKVVQQDLDYTKAGEELIRYGFDQGWLARDRAYV